MELAAKPSQTGGMTAASSSDAIAILRIEIEYIEPLIWRRVAVRTSMNLKALHKVIQAAVIDRERPCLTDGSNKAPGLSKTETDPRSRLKICLLMPKNHKNGAESMHSPTVCKARVSMDD
jgi:pRiA4b ORF-3-like protein